MICSRCNIVLPDDAEFCYKCATPTNAHFTVSNARRVEPLGERETVVIPKYQQVREPTPTRNDFARSTGGFTARNNIALLIGGFVIVGLVLGLVILGGNYFLEKQRDGQSKNTNIADAMVVKNETPTPTPAKTPKAKVIKTPVEQQAPVEETTNEMPMNTAVMVNTNPQIQAQTRTVVNNTFPVAAGHYISYKFNLNTTSRVVGRVEATGGNNDIDTVVLDADEFINYQNRGSYRSFYHSGYTTIGNINLTLAAGTYYVIFSNSNALLTNKVVTAKVEVQ